MGRALNVPRVRLRLEEYESKRIVNVHRHVDGGWFWSKYSAHPYTGCAAGCAFCYERGGKYAGRRDPMDFDRVIRVKVGAVERMRRELSRLPVDLLTPGDWQAPAERRYRMSRGMLEVARDLGFPVLVIERSPLVARDADLLAEIHRRAWAGVLFSMSGVDERVERAFEPKSPPVRARLRAMARLAAAGIPVGASLMPILPEVGDAPAQLDDAVRAIRDHGGTFLLASGLSLEGLQAELTLAATRTLDPTMTMERLARRGDYASAIALRVRALCEKHGVRDRIPRPVLPGPLAVNRRLAERLFLRAYDLEIERAAAWKVWAYRKAAWTVDEHPESLAELARRDGDAALERLPNVGPRIARELAAHLSELGPSLASLRGAAAPPRGQVAMPWA